MSAENHSLPQFGNKRHKIKLSKKLRYRSYENRRRSSVDRIIGELEEFKVEIQNRFQKSKFNHTYVYPRKTTQKKAHDYTESEYFSY